MNLRTTRIYLHAVACLEAVHLLTCQPMAWDGLVKEPMGIGANQLYHRQISGRSDSGLRLLTAGIPVTVDQDVSWNSRGRGLMQLLIADSTSVGHDLHLPKKNDLEKILCKSRCRTSRHLVKRSYKYSSTRFPNFRRTKKKEITAPTSRLPQIQSRSQSLGTLSTRFPQFRGTKMTTVKNEKTTQTSPTPPCPSQTTGTSITRFPQYRRTSTKKANTTPTIRVSPLQSRSQTLDTASQYGNYAPHKENSKTRFPHFTRREKGARNNNKERNDYKANINTTPASRTSIHRDISQTPARSAKYLTHGPNMRVSSTRFPKFKTRRKTAKNNNKHKPKLYTGAPSRMTRLQSRSQTVGSATYVPSKAHVNLPSTRFPNYDRRRKTVENGKIKVNTTPASRMAQLQSGSSEVTLPVAVTPAILPLFDGPDQANFSQNDNTIDQNTDLKIPLICQQYLSGNDIAHIRVLEGHNQDAMYDFAMKSFPGLFRNMSSNEVKNASGNIPRQPSGSNISSEAIPAENWSKHDGDVCCPTKRELRIEHTLTNTHGKRRQIVQFDERGVFQIIHTGRCAHPSQQNCPGICHPMTSIVYLLIFDSDQENPFSFDSFEVDSYCTCLNVG